MIAALVLALLLVGCQTVPPVEPGLVRVWVYPISTAWTGYSMHARGDDGAPYATKELCDEWRAYYLQARDALNMGSQVVVGKCQEKLITQEEFDKWALKGMPRRDINMDTD